MFSLLSNRGIRGRATNKWALGSTNAVLAITKVLPPIINPI